MTEAQHVRELMARFWPKPEEPRWHRSMPPSRDPYGTVNGASTSHTVLELGSAAETKEPAA